MDNISTTLLLTPRKNKLYITSVAGEIVVNYEYVEDKEKKVVKYRIIETSSNKLRMEK